MVVAVSSPNPVTKVEFYIGGSATPDAVDNVAPYSASFLDVSEGNYEIKVIAYDTQGNDVDERIDIEVVNGGVPLDTRLFTPFRGPPIFYTADQRRRVFL